LASGNAIAQTDQQVAAEVIGLAKAQWAAEIANQPIATIMKDVADEYTELSSAFPTRIDGKDVNSRLVEAFSSDPAQLVAAEMANAKVQVYGDVAILSYNFIGLVEESGGSVEPTLAKSTRVYARQNGAWKLVHANFAPVNSDDD
jgi:ketosteroid isomerase-like protein